MLAVVLIAGCSDKETELSIDNPLAGKYQLSGKVEKGPFVRGSSISIQPLDETMTAIGTVFSGEILDDAGSFDIGQIQLASQFVRIASDGYYFNEVSGTLSTGQLHLIALANLSDKTTVNVNILTHLKSARIQKLIQSGKSFAEADKQANRELLSQFGLQEYENTPAESMTITSGNAGSGILIAVSSLILYDRSDAEITQYLSMLSQDLADDGKFTEDNLQRIYSDSEYLRTDIESIASNISNRYVELGVNVSIPDLRYFFDWDGDHIAGNEITPNPQITLSQTEINFGKDGGEATVTIDANFRYSLSPSYGDTNVGNISQSFDFFESPEPLSVETSIDGNTLTIKGGVNKANIKRTYVINLYNVYDDVTASVDVNFAANPDYDMTLSRNGEAVIKEIMVSLTDAHRAYYLFNNSYCLSDNRRLDPYDSELSDLFTKFYVSIGRVNVLSKYLADKDLPLYAKLIQTYNAIAYVEMMELWGDLPLVRYTDDSTDYKSRLQTSQICGYFMSMLKDGLEVASNSKAPGYYESNIGFNTGGNGSRGVTASNLANQLFYLSKDVVYLVLGDLYLHEEDYSEAFSYYKKAIDNYAMSNSLDYSHDNSENIFSPDYISTGSRGLGIRKSVNINLSTYPMYFLSDIKLRMAECQFKLGDSTAAGSIIDEVKSHHDAFGDVSGSLLEQMDLIHNLWHHPAYFAFLKRTGLATSKYGFENYQLLCPIPAQQMALNPLLTQNPGY